MAAPAERVATDKILAETEKEIQAIYSQAYADMQKKIAKRLEIIGRQVNPTDGRIAYDTRQLVRLREMDRQISEVLRDANAEAIKVINGKMVDVYNLNYSGAVKTFPKGTVIPTLGKSAIKSVLTGKVSPFTMLSIDESLARDAIERELTRNLLTGIIQGESIPDLAKRIKGVTNKSLSDSVRVARTETTRIENSAKQDVGEHGKTLGFKMQKRWVATNDVRCRPEHLEANGQIVDIDEPFEVGGEYLMYPGDTSGSAWNVINCRCTTVNIIGK